MQQMNCAAFMDVKSLVKPLGQVKKISRLISSKANPKVKNMLNYLF